MRMNDTVARIVDIMFQDVELNEETALIREEVMNNCQERYTDLIANGMQEDDAIGAVIESLKGMEDVLAPYKNRRTSGGQTMNEEICSGDIEMTFPAEEISRIELTLANEDVLVEASADAFYHVKWSADACPNVQVQAESGVLKITRSPLEGREKHRKEKYQVHMEKSANGGQHIYVNDEDRGEVKFDFSFDSFSDLMNSVGNTLSSIFGKNGVLSRSISFGDGTVTVQIPQQAMPSVRLNTASGDLNIQRVLLADLTVATASGDISAEMTEDQHLAKAELRTTSGDVQVNLFADVANVGSTSGDVEVEGRIRELKVSTVSGDIDVRADVVNLTFKAISGDVDLVFDSDELRSVDGSTISGDVDIDLPDGIGVIGINLQTRSGDVTTRHATNGVGPVVSGSVRSVSGDITIR